MSAARLWLGLPLVLLAVGESPALIHPKRSDVTHVFSQESSRALGDAAPAAVDRRQVEKLRRALAVLAMAAHDPPTGRLDGYALDVTGTPIRGVKVAALREPDGSAMARVYTDEDGFFSMVLPIGQHTLVASAPKLTTIHQQNVPVTGDAPSEVTLIMEVVPEHLAW